MRRKSKSVLTGLLLALTAAGCGGSDSGNPNPNDTPPTANAGADQSGVERTTVQLSGSGGGSDTPLTLAWTQVGGTAGTINNPTVGGATFVAPNIGAGASETATLRLTVTDSTGRTASDDVDITVTEVPPSADAGADQSGVERTTVQLSGSGGGSDTPLTLAWTQVGGTAGTINNPTVGGATFVAPNIGAGASETATLRLTVTDSTGRTASDDVDITVTEVPPSADAGADQAVIELTTVQVNGSGTGSDVPLSYEWTQIAGPAVTIVSAGSAQASFDAPDVGAAAELVTLQLTVTDADGRNATDNVAITISEPPPVVTISGKLEYEFVNPNANCSGLNFSAIDLRPIRQVTVQLIDATTNAVLDSTIADDNGDYSFTADSQTSVFVRVRAELKRSGGSPSWDVEIRDNTSNTGVVLGQRPMYVLDGPAASPNGVDEVRDMLATTGWTGSSFSGTRSAAPFSVLDTIYSAMLLVLSADAQADFSPMDAFWSVNNTPTDGDLNIGEIGGAFYNGGIDSLFLLGKDGTEIDEFDDHLIVHEWGHYFEDNFSRSDSIGGTHFLGDRLDARLAFGEGFATALSGMALANPLYCDTFWAGNTLTGFSIQLENDNPGPAGWYNEISVLKILYDLWDNDVDGVDTSSIGFQPIYDTMIGPQASTDAFTTIFSFMESVKAAAAVQGPFIDAVLGSENVVGAGIDRWGSTETDNAGSADVLPVYTTITPDGTPLNICSTGAFEPRTEIDGNKLGTFRYLRLDIAVQQRYEFDIQADAATIASLPPDDPMSDIDQSDPDMRYYQLGQLQNLSIGGNPEGLSGVANAENFTSFNPIPVGVYVIAFSDFRYEDSDTAAAYPARTCFDFTVTPRP